MTPEEYWLECIQQAADECELTLTPEQAKTLAEAAHGAHDNYGMAFYSPPPGDRLAAVREEHDRAMLALEAENDAFREHVRQALVRALRLHNDARVTVGEYGDVWLHGGRTEQIQ